MRELVILIVLFSMVSCGKSDTPKAEAIKAMASHVIIPETEKLQITWHSNAGVTRYYGFSRGREVRLPAAASVLVDSRKEITVGDIVSIAFSHSRCVYIFNGSYFDFDNCDGQLEAYSHGDVFTLDEIGADAEYPVRVTLDRKIQNSVNILFILYQVQSGGW